MIAVYISLSISIVFISFIVGMVITAVVQKTDFYKKTLSNLNFLESEKLNTLIGVGAVRWLVRNTFFKIFNPNIKIPRGANSADLRRIRDEMTKAEIGHLSAFLFVTLFMIMKIFQQEYTFAVVILAVNVLMNLCPSLLQQQNKRRLDGVISRMTKILRSKT
ncbi:hypothetical protein FIC_01579 [Flavobacteriaceae bacterium 3519-10]|nr:hypothetical protein FIC_01579 [Flavobacteriaceae bacterium 3519-10]